MSAEDLNPIFRTVHPHGDSGEWAEIYTTQVNGERYFCVESGLLLPIVQIHQIYQCQGRSAASMLLRVNMPPEKLDA